MEINFRSLTAEEVEARVSTVSEKGLSLLLYKDARCDMRVLDETVGPECWQREHYECKGNLFCRVGIKLPEWPEWIWKADCGAESYTEKEKGEASDSFKRACFNWGIGRELYTAPFIWVPVQDREGKQNFALVDRGGKPSTNDRFKVTYMGVEDGKIVGLNIENAKTKQTVYTFGKVGGFDVCAVCGKIVPPLIAQKSKEANAGVVYCSGTCKKKAGG